MSVLAGLSLRAGALPVLNLRTGPHARALEYQRYVRFQERLRRRRRELVLFCEHSPTLTRGVQANDSSLRVSVRELDQRGIALASVGRGGDFTAHEPGQCVIYPHIDLRERNLGFGRFFQILLDVSRESIASVWGLRLASREGAPGLYREDGAKLLSIGVMLKAFFSSHGLALNVANDLSAFDLINVCGYPDVRAATVADSGGDPGRVSEFQIDWAARFERALA
jgi:lipoyl(octanoyl) transferase